MTFFFLVLVKNTVTVELVAIALICPWGACSFTMIDANVSVMKR